MNDRQQSHGEGATGRDTDVWLLHALKDLPKETASDGFTDAVLSRIENEEGKRTERFAPFVPWSIALPIAATLMMAALVVPFLVNEDAGVGPASSPQPTAGRSATPFGERPAAIGGSGTLPTRNVGLENLLRDQQSFAAELESLKRSVDDEPPVIYLEGNASADLVIDLSTLVELLEARRAESARGRAVEPGVRPADARPHDGSALPDGLY